MDLDAADSWRVGTPLFVRGRRWRLEATTRAAGCSQLRLAATDGRAPARLSILIPFDRPVRLDPPRRSLVVSPRRWLHELDRRMAALHPFGGLATAARSSIRLLPYQLEPAIATLRFGICRLLVADDVGLGKTIQAGLILSELAAASDAFRALVLVPAGLRDQWIRELADHFALAATAADAHWLRQSTLDRPAGINPWALPGIYAASHDFIKRAEALRPLERTTWDIVIIDEAHAAGVATDRRAALDAIAARAVRVVLLTATPNRGDPAAFCSLCRIGAASASDPPPTLFDRRRAVVDAAPPRKTLTLPVSLSGAEWRMHRLLERYAARIWHEADGRGDERARLVSIVLRKRALSSAFALAVSIRRRSALLTARAEPPGETQLLLPLADEDPLEDDEGMMIGAPGLSDVKRERWWLRAVAAAAREAARRESKLQWLLRLLRRVREPVIVFTEYRDTLRRLHRAIARTGRPLLLLHGGMAATERRVVPAEFAKGNCLLLATDAAAEGLNLQHRCRVVIHYELPWNPARLEQRAGRVDRIGQARRVHELALVANTSAERLVLAPLLKHGARGGDIERSRSLAGLTESRVADAIVRRVALEVPRAWSATEPPCVTKPPELIARIAAAEAERLGRARILLHRSAAAAPLPPRPPIVITRPRRAKRRAVERLNLLYAIHLETPAGRSCHSEIVPLAIRVRDPTEAGARPTEGSGRAAEPKRRGRSRGVSSAAEDHGIARGRGGRNRSPRDAAAAAHRRDYGAPAGCVRRSGATTAVRSPARARTGRIPSTRRGHAAA